MSATPKPSAARPTLPLALCLLATATAALADVGPSVEILLDAPQGVLPQAGQSFACDLRLTSGEDAVGESPQLTSARLPDGRMAWEVISLPAPSRFDLPAMQPVVFPLRLGCNDPSAPLEIRLRVDGRAVTRHLNLLPQGLNSAAGGEETFLKWDSDKGAPPVVDASFARPDPAPIARQNVRDRRAEMADPSKGRNIRVHGRFVYFRQSRDDDGVYMGDDRQMGADGVTVNVYDEDWDWDDLLAQTVLGPDGSFDITFYYGDSEAPDIYIEFLAANSKVDLVYPSIWNTSYRWRTPVRNDFQGTTINYGTRWPASQGHYAGLHILATATQSWRWLSSNGYGGIDNVLVSWPDSDWPHYKAIWETIYIPAFRQWNEGTIAHEYGHHWQQEYSVLPSNGYCNDGGFYDPPNRDCGHGAWCRENSGVALQEGFANWISHAVTRGFPGTYGFSAIFERDYETIARCDWNNNGQWHDPNLSGGFLTAFLQDVIDGNNETDPGALDNGRDALSWPVSRVLSAQGTHDPTSPVSLINTLRVLYPQEAQAIWLTAANNRYELLDLIPPSTPTGFTSTSHQAGGDSPDRTVDFVWNASTDDFSGISHYAVTGFHATQPSWSRTWLAYETQFTTPLLNTGTWTFVVDAVDNAGNASSSSPTFGPVTLREPIPADIRPHPGNTWPYAVVPRNTNDATDLSAPLPAVLNGNSNTYINIRLQNYGEQATTPTLRLNYFEDGLLNWYTSIFSLPGLSERSYRNLGPFPMRGGRHAVGVWADAFEQMPEADETDNFWSRQFVWSPLTLTNSFVERERPPYAWGGFDWTIFSSPNADGFRFSMGTIPFVGAVMLPGNLTADYDAASFTSSTGSTNGFSLGTRKVQSLRPAGCLDAVFANNEQTAETTIDVGVLNYANHHGTFKIRRLQSSWLGNGGVQVFLTADAPMQLRHLFLPVNAGTNHGRVTLQADPADGPVHIMVIPNQVTHASLSSLPTAATDESGFARLDYTYTTQTQGLVVWQDPRDVPAGASGSLTAWLWSGPTPPDLVPHQTAGWHAPLVPTHGAPGTPSSTPLPGVLTGDTPTTYFNAQMRNQAAGFAQSFVTMVDLDGQPTTGEEVSSLAGFSNLSRNYPWPVTVRGGRHTLSLRLDTENWVAEGDETNNQMGLQYVWSPLPLAAGPAVSRAAPPDPLGGFAAAAAWSAAPVWFNCDGLRTPAPAPSGNAGWWQAVAVIPGQGGDVDLRLHEAVNSTLDGFRDPLAVSIWSAGESDYVLVNLRATTPRAFDVGAVGPPGTSTGPGYQVQSVASSFLGHAPQGAHGPFTLAGADLIALHEVYLEAGFLQIRLRPLDNQVDWGLTLHRGQLPFHSKSATAGIMGQAWSAPAGVDEFLPVQVPQAGYQCLAVWKTGYSGISQTGAYELLLSPGSTSAPDQPAGAPPPATALKEIWPNPFNPSTQIAFDLARPGWARLEIFDVRGKLIRRLVAEELPAGRHRRTWDGCDELGDTVASGAYLARLTADGQSSSRKMLLMK